MKNQNNTSISASITSQKPAKKAITITIGATLIVIAILMIVFIAYVNSYSRANTEGLQQFETTYLSQSITVAQDKAGNIAVKQKDTAPTTALIFYPGGKVENTAYIPLMQKCAESGILCIIARMPCNLAFLNTGAANSIKKAHPEITNWYIGGHSLGGVAASSYVKKHADDFDGLILLGSYASKDISNTNINVLTIRGTNDEVVTLSDHNENLSNLPSGYREAFIEGGCHAYFGMYGEQKGDGTPTISPQDQIIQTAYLITGFINSN